MQPCGDSLPNNRRADLLNNRWRTNDLMDLVLIDGRPHVVSAPARSLSVLECSPLVAVALVRLLAAAQRGVPGHELVRVNARLGERAVDILQSAVHSDLLKPAQHTQALPVFPRADPRVQRQQQLRRARHYSDYAAPTVFDDDASHMRTLAARESPPPLEPGPLGPTLRLAHPATTASRSSLAALGHTLFYGFGVLRPARFLDVLDVQLRPVPSFGARHPFDAVVTLPPCNFLGAPAGCYTYVPSNHMLVRHDDAPPGITTVVLEVRAVFERVQWRYRQAIAYEMLLLDLGHLRQQLTLSASGLGLNLTEIRNLMEIRAGGRADDVLTTAVMTAYEIRRDKDE